MFYNQKVGVVSQTKQNSAHVICLLWNIIIIIIIRMKKLNTKT